MQAAGDAFEALLEYAHRKAKAGGEIFSCVDSGQTQRLASVSPNQLWLGISPLENLGIPMESSTRLDDERVQLLRRRMRFLALFARLAMTPECDWRFNQGARSKWMAPAANWCDILSRLGMNSKQPERVHFFLRFSPPRFLIRLHSYPMPGAMPEMLEQFLSGVLETGVRDWLPAENPVRRLLEANDRSGFTRPQPIELGIELCVWKLSLSCLLEILRVLDRFMAAQQQHRQQAVSDRTCNDRVDFYVSAIYIDSRCDLTSGAIELLGDLAGELDHLNPKHLALGWSSSANLSSISRCVTGILTGPPGNPLGRLERLVLDMTEIAAGVVCSALRQSTRLREVELTLPMNLHTAAWLAFGIFHADSSSSVTSVRLNTTTTSLEHCLTTSWMGIFKRVLSSPASSQDLAPAATQKSKRDKAPLNSELALKEVPLPTGQRVFVTPVASARARAQPHLRSSVVGTVCEREVQVV